MSSAPSSHPEQLAGIESAPHKRWRQSLVPLAFAIVAMTTANAQTDDRLFDEKAPLQIADQGIFYVTGTYSKEKSSTVMSGQMFVQFQVPAKKTRPYPIVMIHGGGQTGSNFLGTPDGRRGWADYYVAHGYAVYVVDQVGRGRSGYFQDSYGPTRKPSAEAMASRFTAIQKSDYPQSRFHTQWPGSGTRGDPVFDQVFAQQVEDMEDLTKLEQLNRDALVKLLERIGPAVVLTHSQSGAVGWLAADARPGLIKALIAVEPSGPPVNDSTQKDFGPAPAQSDQVSSRPNREWGITRSPLNYEPRAASASDLRFAQERQPDGPDLVRCTLQVEPARRLVNLQNIPVLMVESQSSYHAPYDHCTARFLQQAGVKVDFSRLQDKGITGNGHLMFLEKNSFAIAHFIESWEQKTVR